MHACAHTPAWSWVASVRSYSWPTPGGRCWSEFCPVVSQMAGPHWRRVLSLACTLGVAVDARSTAVAASGLEGIASARLVDAAGASARVGLAQVRTGGGAFGTVCGMNLAASDVLCRQLGASETRRLARAARP